MALQRLADVHGRGRRSMGDVGGRSSSGQTIRLSGHSLRRRPAPPVRSGRCAEFGRVVLGEHFAEHRPVQLVQRPAESFPDALTSAPHRARIRRRTRWPPMAPDGRVRPRHLSRMACVPATRVRNPGTARERANSLYAATKSAFGGRDARLIWARSRPMTRGGVRCRHRRAARASEFPPPRVRRRMAGGWVSDGDRAREGRGSLGWVGCRAGPGSPASHLRAAQSW